MQRKRYATFPLTLLAAALFATTAQTQQPQNHATALRAGVAGVGTPQCLYCPSPESPRLATNTKPAGGKVIVDVTVTSAGSVLDPTLVKGIGDNFDQQAMSTVRKWKMKPAIGPDGHPVDCRVNVELSFSDSAR